MSPAMLNLCKRSSNPSPRRNVSIYFFISTIAIAVVIRIPATCQKASFVRVDRGLRFSIGLVVSPSNPSRRVLSLPDMSDGRRDANCREGISLETLPTQFTTCSQRVQLVRKMWMERISVDSGPAECKGHQMLLDELPLPALAAICSHLGPRPDSFLRCCQSVWRLHGDLHAWASWMLVSYGASDALHKLRRMDWSNKAVGSAAGGSEQDVGVDSREAPLLAAVSLLLAAGADPNLLEERQGFWAPPAILWAVSKGFAEVALRLTAAGAQVDENVLCAAAAQVRDGALLRRLCPLIPHLDRGPYLHLVHRGGNLYI